MWGAVGTALATVISEITVTGYQMYAIRNQINMRKLFVSYWKYLLAGFLMFVIVFRFGAVLKDSWLMILIEIITGMISY